MAFIMLWQVVEVTGICSMRLPPQAEKEPLRAVNRSSGGYQCLHPLFQHPSVHQCVCVNSNNTFRQAEEHCSAVNNVGGTTILGIHPCKQSRGTSSSEVV